MGLHCGWVHLVLCWGYMLCSTAAVSWITEWGVLAEARQGLPRRRDPTRCGHAEASWVCAGGCELMWGGPWQPWLGSRRGSSCQRPHPQLSGTQGSCSPLGQYCSRSSMRIVSADLVQQRIYVDDKELCLSRLCCLSAQ